MYLNKILLLDFDILLGVIRKIRATSGGGVYQSIILHVKRNGKSSREGGGLKLLKIEISSVSKFYLTNNFLNLIPFTQFFEF